MSELLYYVDDFTDEVLPCAPTLEAWARWLHEGDEDWPGPHARHGEVFRVSVTRVVDVEAHGPAPLEPLGDADNADMVAIRIEPGLGWMPDDMFGDLEEALASERAEEIASDPDGDGVVHLAALYEVGERFATFQLTADGPVLELGGAAQ